MYIKWCIGSSNHTRKVHFYYHYKYVSSKVQSAITVLNVFSIHTQTHTHSGFECFSSAVTNLQAQYLKSRRACSCVFEWVEQMALWLRSTSLFRMSTWTAGTTSTWWRNGGEPVWERNPEGVLTSPFLCNKLSFKKTKQNNSSNSCGVMHLHLYEDMVTFQDWNANIL